jgi:hypothetical protein
LWLGGALLLVLILIGVLISMMLRRIEPIMRAEIVEKLQERFHARVELDSFHVSLVNGLWAEGKGLRIWPPAQVVGLTVPGANGAAVAASSWPLIRLEEFRFHAPIVYRLGKPIKISVVQLKGLDVDVPPKTHFSHAEESHEDGNQRHLVKELLHFEVDSFECTDAHLTLETDKPGKMPLEFAIAQLTLSNVNMGGPMGLSAELTNPRPKGPIFTTGSIGPWAAYDPGETPVAGEYRFENADMGVFKGIAGILNSTGKYQGVLRDLVVDGQTDMQDFRLTDFGTALTLHTNFHAHVDGTNGDTWLQPVDAILGRSHFTAEGKIVRVAAETTKNGTQRPGGHEISLTVNVDHARIEDFLRLTSRSGTPLLNGDVKVKSSLDGVAFTSEKIQNDVGQLSLRGQGRPKEAKDAKNNGGADVLSTMQSDFTMVGGVIALPDLIYTVPGAEIDLKGTYSVKGGVLDFAGVAKTQATVSQLVGGWKGLLLTPADRFFKKDGAGTEVPIHIDGTREDPKFGVDLKRMKHTSPAIPGQSP